MNYVYMKLFILLLLPLFFNSVCSSGSQMCVKYEYIVIFSLLKDEIC